FESIEALPKALVDISVISLGTGAPPLVTVFNATTGVPKFQFLAFGAGFLGGVHTAVGDVNGDGIPDIIAGAGAGGGPNVRVFDGNTGAMIRSFFAYDAGFMGGVNVAAGDVNADGFADIITGAGPGGGPHVKVFDGQSNALIRSFFADDPGFN